MTGPDLIRLAQELARCGGIHRLTNLVTAAIHVCLEHERRGRAGEEWEAGVYGAGMSDRVVRTDWRCGHESPTGTTEISPSSTPTAERHCSAAPSSQPAAEEPSGRAADLRLRDIDEMDARITAAIEAARERPPAAAEPLGRTTEAQNGRAPKSIDLQTTAAAVCNPHPITHPRDEHKPLPMTGGITHGEGSPIAEKHSGPSDRLVPRFKPVDPTIAAEDPA